MTRSGKVRRAKTGRFCFCFGGAAACAFLFFAVWNYPLAILQFGVIQLNAVIAVATPAAVSAAALAIIFLRPERAASVFRRSGFLFKASLALISLISLWHFIRHGTYRFDDLSDALLWLSVPLLAVCFRRWFVRYLPWWAVFLWVLDVSHWIFQELGHLEPVGIPGNRNWHAAFLLVACAFTLFHIWRFARPRLGAAAASAVCFFPAALTGFVEWRCESRGAVLGLIVSSALLIFFSAGKKYKIALAGAGAVFALAVVVWLAWLGGSDWLGRQIAVDVRIPLWEGTLRLIRDNWLTGCGPSAFESSYASYNPPDYYLRAVAAVRNNDPHNHFLLMATGFGVFGFCAFFYLLVYPAARFFIGFHRERSPLMKVYIFCYVILFVHSMLDMIATQWPTSLLLLMITGILWERAFLRRAGNPAPPGRGPVFWLFPRVAGCALLLWTLGHATVCCVSGNWHRNGLIFGRDKEPEISMHYLDKCAWSGGRFEPEHVYKAGMCAFTELGNRNLAMQYLKFLREETPCYNFAHSNGFTGIILLERGRIADAVPFMLNEVKNYPMSTIAWHNMHKLYQILGMREQADDAWQKVETTMRLKNLDMKYLQMVLGEPKFDLRPGEITADTFRAFDAAHPSSPKTQTATPRM